MRNLFIVLVGLVGFTTLAIPVAFSQSDRMTDWTRLPPIPDKLGVAGPFSGEHNGVLLLAGGANFPDKMPWDGGTKIWHDRVYALSDPTSSWIEAGKLPRPLGYGVSITTPNGIVCVGGSDLQRHYADCFRLLWENQRLTLTELPSLPKPVANMCGAALGNTLYIAGGIETPTSTLAMHSFYCIDLSAPQSQWRELETWPGPERMLAVAAVQEGAFFLMSGVSLTPDNLGKPVRKYLTDAYTYKPESGWRRIANLPRPAVAAPTPAMAHGSNGILVIGGDDGANVGFQPPERHPGFPTSILRYQSKRDEWSVWHQAPLGQVTTTIVPWGNSLVIPSGEVRPGVRTPEVWAYRPKE
ncbi:MAG: hypothetical protein ABL921_27345 [Pirellula sp.]